MNQTQSDEFKVLTISTKINLQNIPDVKCSILDGLANCSLKKWSRVISFNDTRNTGLKLVKSQDTSGVIAIYVGSIRIRKMTAVNISTN